jgi:hypothetical protein
MVAPPATSYNMILSKTFYRYRGGKKIGGIEDK